MSGGFALPYVAANTANVSGLVMVASTGVKEVSTAEWKRIADDTHVMFVYGELDDLIGVPAATYLEHNDDIQVSWIISDA